ncbi:MAG: glucosamine-6-phosphate deaminase [Anaerolineae bacterium]
MPYCTARPSMERALKADELKVEVYANRTDMGTAAAQDVAERMKQVISEKGRVVMVFAAAPSQNEFLAALAADKSLDWRRVIAFHLDEYVALPPDAPQGFGNYLRRHLFDLVKPGFIHFMNGFTSDLQAECRRYSELLAANPPDIACIGIGENGHLAFNDPSVADFNDPARVKMVELEERCRLQQVHDGCFNDLASVPTHALTMTVPAIVSAASIHCIVPGATKAEAVRDTIKGPVATSCPASILRRYATATLYLDRDSAALL